MTGVTLISSLVAVVAATQRSTKPDTFAPLSAAAAHGTAHS